MLAFDYYNFTYFVSILYIQKSVQWGLTLDRERDSGVDCSEVPAEIS